VKVVVGQEVAMYRGGYFDDTYTFGVVQRVTPSGQIVVVLDNGMEAKFNKHGAQLTEHYNRTFLNLDVERIRASTYLKATKQAASRAINAVVSQETVQSTYSKECMVSKIAELRALLAEAEKAVEAIPA